MPDQHAKRYRPSSASRWTVCTASALIEETLPDTDSPYTKEGTEAHSLCERKLRCLLEDSAIPKDGYDDEMWECTEKYRDFVEEELNAARSETPDAKLLIEQQFDLSAYAPESFGTSDAVIVSDDVLEVIDFKYGKGVRVDAEGNQQSSKTPEAMSRMWREFAEVFDQVSIDRADEVAAEIHNGTTVSQAAENSKAVLSAREAVNAAKEKLAQAREAADKAVADKKNKSTGYAKAVADAKQELSRAQAALREAEDGARKSVELRLSKSDAVERFGKEAADNFSAAKRVREIKRKSATYPLTKPLLSATRCGSMCS